MNSQDIWFNNITILFDPNYILEIIPLTSMSYGAKINAMTRFALYLSVLLTVIKKKYIYLYIFIVPVLITYILYIFDSRESFVNNAEENSTETNNVEVDAEENNVSPNNEINYRTNVDELEASVENCVKPSNENPLMNIMLTDNFEKRKPACNINNKKISDSVTAELLDSYKDKLYNDTTSIYNPKINERAFYTMPNTEIPNDQTSFANWLYNTPVSCSSGEIGLLKQYRGCAYDYKNMNELKYEMFKKETEASPNNSGINSGINSASSV